MRTKRSSDRPVCSTRRGLATKQRIIEAAAGLVVRHGVAATSLDDIMDASGTSKSQLYHYFADREALMCAVVEAQAGRVLDGQHACLAGLRSVEDLRAWRDGLVAASRASGGIGGCPIGSLASALADRSEAARTRLEQSFRQWEFDLAATFRAMQASGSLRLGKSPEDLALAIIAALQGGLLLAQTSRSMRPLELALDMAIAHVEDAARVA